MILVQQGENHRVLGFGSPRSFFENQEIQLAVFQFAMVKIADESYICPLGYPEYKLVACELISNRKYVNPETLILSDDDSGIPAFNFFTSRTIGDIYTEEQIAAMTPAEIREISRYDMDAEDVEKFILANGYLTGVRI